MPYFTNCIQYITEIDSIDVIATYLFIQQFFIILTFQSQISLCTENSYITILQPDLQLNIHYFSHCNTFYKLILATWDIDWKSQKIMLNIFKSHLWVPS